VIATKDPSFDLMQRELFGPVVTTYVYDEKRFDDTLDVVNATSPYALTGAVFATDRSAISQAHDALRDAAGNFYVNDKPTGAVVGQQPFGGARASGTNDKAGSMWNLIRWTSPRAGGRLPVPVHGRGVAWRERPNERWHRCRDAPVYPRPRRMGSSCCAIPSSWTA
jgi:1-pyrroline-5-carboxylate dehydrogenase